MSVFTSAVEKFERIREVRSPDPTLDISVERLNRMLTVEPEYEKADNNETLENQDDSDKSEQSTKKRSRAGETIDALETLHDERQVAMTSLFLIYTGLILEGKGPDDPIKKSAKFHMMQKRIGDTTLSVMHARPGLGNPWTPFGMSYDSDLIENWSHETQGLDFKPFDRIADSYVSRKLPLSVFMGCETDGTAEPFDDSDEGQQKALELTERAMALSDRMPGRLTLRDPSSERMAFEQKQARFALHASHAMRVLHLS